MDDIEPEATPSKRACSLKGICKQISPTETIVTEETKEVNAAEGAKALENINPENWRHFGKRMCEICGQSVTCLTRHLRSHAKEGKYGCPYCTVQMSDSSNLLRHIRSVHLKIVVKTCELCGKGFVQYNTFNDHMRSKHGIGEKYECKICFKNYLHPAGLKQHQQRAHTDIRKNECELCHKRFKSKYEQGIIFGHDSKLNKCTFSILLTDANCGVMREYIPKKDHSHVTTAQNGSKASHFHVNSATSLIGTSLSSTCISGSFIRNRVKTMMTNLMVSTLREITNICRLCLCEELEILIPTKDVLNTSLTSDDVERITGVRIPTDDNVPYVMCTTCRNSLRKSVAFRNSCIRNDRLYMQLFSEYIDDIRTVAEIRQIADTIDQLDVGDFEENNYVNDKQELLASHGEDYSEFGNEDAEACASEKSKEKPLKVVRSNKSSRKSRAKVALVTETSEQNGTQSGKLLKIANLQDWSNFSKRLCELCGQMVTNFKRHLLSHTKNAKYACPHCSVQMTDSSNLIRHINAVHKKTIIKTCDICNQGFTHYNSYNSHLRIKHGKGEKYGCKICPKKFNHPSGLREHIKRVHTFESKYECTLCQKRFKTSRSLRLHGRVHSDNQPYPCSHCPKRFKSSFARNTHQLTHTGVIFSCELCKKSYRYKSLLSIHMRKDHPEAVRSAENTEDQDEDMLIPVANVLDAHITIENIERFTGIVIDPVENILHAICTDCEARLQKCAAFRRSCLRNDAYLRKLYSEASAEESEAEITDTHFIDSTDDKVYNRTVKRHSSCGSTSQQSMPEVGKRVTSQLQDYHAASAPEPHRNGTPLPLAADNVEEELYSANYIAPGEVSDEDEYFLTDDDEYFAPARKSKSTKEMQMDKEYISNEMYHLLDLSKYQRPRTLCELCGKAVSDIVSHLLSHRKEAIFGCPHCNVRMTHQANMMRHIREVHERRIVKSCDLCGKGFTHNNSYISHMLSRHGIGEKQECKQCKQKFNHRSGLREHIKRYHNIQFYDCTLCDKTFKMKRALKTHQLVHSSEKPYPCPKCPKRFKSSKARSCHLLTHAGVLFSCTLCNKSYRYKTLLNLHRRNAHPDATFSEG
uniref:Protein krueppel n=1 Tax=Anopheles epiroticus TaxID=199890 RepID=A0A182P531_9DIPT